MEQWKDIEGFEGLYKVSNQGRILSLCKDSIKPLAKRGKGYLYAHLFKNGKQYCLSVHRLVASAFLENPNNLSQVNHKDEDKTNNNVNNLEWCNCSYNINYGSRNKKLFKKVYQIDGNNNVVKIWDSIISTKQGGFNYRKVSECCNGRLDEYKGFVWKFNVCG